MKSVRKLNQQELELILNNYIVYDDGRVFSKRSKKFLKPGNRGGGYYGVTLSVNFIQFQMQVHRLVAIFHIPNPEGLPVINHKDGNKMNNHVDNLEWCTVSHNLQHAHEMQPDRSGVKVDKYSTSGEHLGRFTSIKSAVESINKGTISGLCKFLKSDRDAYMGYVWKTVNKIQ